MLVFAMQPMSHAALATSTRGLNGYDLGEGIREAGELAAILAASARTARKNESSR